jgi:hypothetical protein
VQVPDRKKKHVTHFFAAETEELRNKWIALINREARLNTSNKVFGVALEDVRERDENGVPLFVSALLTFLLATGTLRQRCHLWPYSLVKTFYSTSWSIQKKFVR